MQFHEGRGCKLTVGRMNAKNAIFVTFLTLAMSAGTSEFLPSAFGSPANLQAQGTVGQNAVIKRLGTIKTINGNAIILAQDSGPDVTLNVQPSARVLRIAPGEKDLKNAVPIQLQDLQVGDTIRARGYASADTQSVAALEVIVITRSTVDAVRDQIRQDWQKRGMGGLVSAVDPATGTVTISVTGLGGTKTIAVRSSKNTVFRRYAPDSVKYEDAKPSTLQEIQSGDQLRARGNRSADGTEFSADEIVSGSFRNIAGTVNSVDAAAGTLKVEDLFTKKTVQVKITADSQLHKIPAEIAQRLAMRIKASMPPGMPGAAASPSPSASAAPAPQAQGQGSQTPAAGTNPGPGGTRSGGSFDLQQMLNRMPSVALSDLHKGDAVMMVTTQGSVSNPGTAITLLSGVEPILEAAPKGSQAMMLAPWSLGAAPGGDASQ